MTAITAVFRSQVDQLRDKIEYAKAGILSKVLLKLPYCHDISAHAFRG